MFLALPGSSSGEDSLLPLYISLIVLNSIVWMFVLIETLKVFGLIGFWK
jgi:hypothetical protein